MRKVKYLVCCMVMMCFTWGVAVFPCSAKGSIAAAGCPTYGVYAVAHQSAAAPQAKLEVQIENYIEMDLEKCSLSQDDAEKSYAIGFYEDSGFTQWQIEILETGLYTISLDYMACQGRNRDIELSFQIDGETLFQEMEKFSMPRVWADQGEIVRDNQGNDVRPQKYEVAKWSEYILRDADGLYSGAFQFYLEKGTHVIRLTSLSESFMLGGLRLYGAEPLNDYYQALAVWNELHSADQSDQLPRIDISAEKTYQVSSPVLYPISDRSGPNTESQGEMNDVSKIRLNAIGGTNWKFAGQSISWRFQVEQAGYYKVVLKARQNFSRGMVSSREVRIDGEVPFQELSVVAFPYAVDWQMITLGQELEDGFMPYLVYLEPGEHELAMEVVPGSIAELLRTTEQTVLELNALYRKMIMVTGTDPDPYQDYYLEKKVPGLLKDFEVISTRLKKQVADLELMTGIQGSEASLLEEVSIQLDSMIKKPDTIPVRLENFKENITSLGTWILQLREQPLELDYIALMDPEETVESATAGFFSKLYFDVAGVVMSFFEDYQSVGNVYEGQEALDIWISQADLSASGSSSGRDQAMIIKRLIDDSFTVETGIAVNLNLVDSSQTLVRAVMGNQGPDIALTLPESTPVNLAMRGALCDLTQFEDFDEVMSRFYPSSWVAYQYLDGVYAMPETQTFNMLFYRTDVFEELGLEPPDTWEDFYKVVPVLQKNNLQVGIPEAQDIFEMFLFQKGGSFYTEDLRSTGFDQPQALEAFMEWTGLYANHGLPLYFDFYNRFRTGEMPMGITNYSFYNTLAIAAPELRNLWRMIPVPGTLQQDGSINRKESCYGTAAVIMETTANKDAAWEFLKWWTRADIQSRYGLELEYLIGTAARYNTANVEAFQSLPWKTDERENIQKQWEQVWDVEQLPGNYATDRNIQFAFRRVVYYYENEREALYEYNKEINKELVRKRQEFGLE